jgi:hypothetical protein
MKIPGPKTGQRYDRIIKDQNDNPIYGIRNEHSSDEEIVHIPSGTSNSNYYIPEPYLTPIEHQHDFVIVDMAKREIQCKVCNFHTSFVVGINFVEENEQAFVILKDKKYPVNLQ